MTISREAQSIIDYVESTGLAYRVTSVYRPHSTGSYHAAQGTDGDGLAVDLAGVTPGVTPATTAQMAAIYGAFLLVAAQLNELIFSGADVTVAVKNGRRVDGPTVYAAVWARHRDHVHVAVPRGVFLTPLSHLLGTLSKEASSMPDNPDLANIEGPLSFQGWADQDGNVRAYAIFSTSTGELHGYGPGWTYHGRSEDPTPE